MFDQRLVDESNESLVELNHFSLGYTASVIVLPFELCGVIKKGTENGGHDLRI